MIGGRKAILSLTHVMNDLGNILSYDDICGKYNVSCSPKCMMYDKIIKSIPLQMINLVKEQVKYSIITPKMPDLMT